MNMKRIVFVAVGILIMLAIMGFTLHSMTKIDEMNQKRREQKEGEALASRLVTTVATTSVWDALRTTETETIPGNSENSGDFENPEYSNNPENPGNPENPDNYENPENSGISENPEIPEISPQEQTITEAVPESLVIYN